MVSNENIKEADNIPQRLLQMQTAQMILNI